MLEALQEKGVSSEIMVLEGAGHGFRGAARTRASEAMVNWFEKHLVAGKG